MKKLTKLAILGTIFATPFTMLSAEKISIGTGGATGVYYPVGSSICSLLSRSKTGKHINCTAETTAGSIFNINSIREGELDFGIAQSDWQYHAYNGSSHDTFVQAGPFKKLRSVFSLHGEPFTVFVRKDSGIKDFNDLRGKRVNVGDPTSGTRATLQLIMDKKGWTLSDFKLATELKASEQSTALTDGKIDVGLYTVGHPNSSLMEAATNGNASGNSVAIVNVVDKDIDEIVNSQPYYAYTTIAKDTYPPMNMQEDVVTFGMKATLVTSSDVDSDVVYEVTKAVFDNIKRFRRLHPALATLDEKEMVTSGMSAPLHDGAVKYYKEAKLQ